MRKKIVGLIIVAVLGIGSSTSFPETIEAGSKPDIDPINIVLPYFE